MAKAELGRIHFDPETGRKFYDNRDPIVSPYTGKSYPRSYFDTGRSSKRKKRLKPRNWTARKKAPNWFSLETDNEASGGDDCQILMDDEDDVDSATTKTTPSLKKKDIGKATTTFPSIIGVGDDDEEG
ncbi:MAG: TIGR02300 family protein [Mesorhizobium sp.]